MISGLRLRSEVSEDEEAGESSGEEDENEPEGTHFPSPLSLSLCDSETCVTVRGISVVCDHDYVMKMDEWGM